MHFQMPQYSHLADYQLDDGILCSCVKLGVPVVYENDKNQKAVGRN